MATAKTAQKKSTPKLNKAQRQVLVALSDGPKATSNVTRGETVSGISSHALSKMGLVKVKPPKKGSTNGSATITAAGRKLLAS